MDMDQVQNNEVKKENNIEQNLEQIDLTDNSLVTEKEQNSFLQSTLGKVINTGVDIGLRGILPNVIEDQVIDIKNVMINNGLKEGINTAINSAIDLGKSAMGIFTGKFDNLSQAQTAVKKGGILDSVSSVIDSVLKVSTKNDLINSKTSKLIKKGKNLIIDTVSSNIEESFMSQLKGIEKIGKYTKNWNTYFENKDLDGMEKEYKKIKTQMKEIMPLQTTLQQVKQIENIQNLIKNKGEFNLSNEELELAKKLA